MFTKESADTCFDWVRQNADTHGQKSDWTKQSFVYTNSLFVSAVGPLYYLGSLTNLI